jgi:hypothetical protein
MPTTLTGLLLFAVLLLPGFAYLVGKERAGTERRVADDRICVHERPRDAGWFQRRAGRLTVAALRRAQLAPRMVPGSANQPSGLSAALPSP